MTFPSPFPVLPLAGKAVVAKKGDQPDQKAQKEISGYNTDEHQTHIDINPVLRRICIRRTCVSRSSGPRISRGIAGNLFYHPDGCVAHVHAVISEGDFRRRILILQIIIGERGLCVLIFRCIRYQPSSCTKLSSDRRFMVIGLPQCGQ